MAGKKDRPQPYQKQERRSARQKERALKKSSQSQKESQVSNNADNVSNGVPADHVAEPMVVVDSVVPPATSELADLKNSVQSLSTMIGQWMNSMSSLLLPGAIPAVNLAQSSVPVVTAQPQSEQVVTVQPQPSASAIDNQIDAATAGVSPVSLGLASETFLQQAVSEHVSAITDSSHHPPGKRFSVVGRLIDRHISEKIKKDIWEDRYVDLHLLVSQSEVEDQQPILAPGKAGEPARWAEPKPDKKKFDIDQWCKAFCVYISLYTRKHTSATPQLMSYYSKVQSLAARGGDFNYYDVEFRIAREQEGIPWEIPLLDLWMECLPLKDGVSIQQGSQSFRSSGSGFRGSKQHNSKQKSQFHHPKGYCFNFHNSGKCPKGNDCRFSHSCWVPTCGGKHPVFKCYKLKNQSFKNNSAQSSGST